MKVWDYPLDGSGGAYPSTPMLEPFDPASLAQQRVDAHCLASSAGEVLARASLWWQEAPPFERERLGVIGHFGAADGAAAALLLGRLLERLAEHGCTMAVGPMDGNTWRRYRFVTEAGEEPPFFLEPDNPPEYPGYFLAAGFTPLAHYRSALVSDLSVADGRIPAAIERLHAAGVRWRPLALERFEEELRAIYHLSCKSFVDNFLFTPLSEAEFMANYRAVRPHLHAELVLMAECASELIGYLFAIPDLNQRLRGEAIDTCIVKTLAVVPGRRWAGLGSVLVAECHRIARQLGFRRAIHAPMHDSNRSRSISAHYSQTMRGYTLFHHRLHSGR